MYMMSHRKFIQSHIERVMKHIPYLIDFIDHPIA